MATIFTWIAFLASFIGAGILTWASKLSNRKLDWKSVLEWVAWLYFFIPVMSHLWHFIDPEHSLVCSDNEFFMACHHDFWDVINSYQVGLLVEVIFLVPLYWFTQDHNIIIWILIAAEIIANWLWWVPSLYDAIAYDVALLILSLLRLGIVFWPRSTERKPRILQ